jgi:hypothetical protein
MEKEQQMKLNRREFVRVGSIGAAGMLVGCEQRQPAGAPPAVPASSKATSLEIQIKGLVLAHWTKPSLTIRLIDGNAVGLGAHLAHLAVPADRIDPASTVPHTPHPRDTSLRVIDLSNKSVTLPATAGSGVTVEDAPIQSALPATPEAWRSIRHAVYLPTVAGATQAGDTSKVYATVLINAGHLECDEPEGEVGGVYLWTFKNPQTGQAVAPEQAVTNVLLCTTSFAAGSTFMVGSQTLVLTPGPVAKVTISNEPRPLPPGTSPPVCTGGRQVCADHLSVYYDMVNATVKPIAEGRRVTPASAPLVDPNYCPPAFI